MASNNYKSYYINAPLWLVLLSVSFIILIFNFFNHDFNLSISGKVKTNMLAVRYFVKDGLYSYINDFGFKSKLIEELREENKKLKMEIAYLSKKSIEVEYLKNKIFSLNSLLNIYDSKSMVDIITTSVVSNSIGSISNNLSINIGSEQGIKENILVISSTGVVGYTYDVKAKSARIMTIFNKNFRLSVITERSKVNAIITSDGTKEPAVIPYSQDIKMIDGEVAYTSGLEGTFPKHIAVGTIRQNKKDINSNEYTWKIQFFENFLNLDYVHIVK